MNSNFAKVISIFKNIDENCSFSGLHENEKLPKYILLVGKQGQTVHKIAKERERLESFKQKARKQNKKQSQRKKKQKARKEEMDKNITIGGRPNTRKIILYTIR